MPKKPSRPSGQKKKATRDLPLSKDQAKHVKGGGRPVAWKTQ